MKPSLDVLKNSRDRCREMAESYTKSAAEYDAQIAEEEREAKEWPQEGDECWWLDSQGSVTETTSGNGWKAHILAMGLLFRTRAEAELVRDFLRSRPRGWLLAMAKLTPKFHLISLAPILPHQLRVDLDPDKWNALTEDERAALLGQG